MAIADGVPADASHFNTAFVSRTVAQTVAGGKSFSQYIATDPLDVATTATIAALASTNSAVRMTGSTITSIQGITAGTDGQHILIYNASSAVVTIAHQNGSASAANRLILPAGTAISLDANESAEFMYDSAQSRWVVKSLATGGGSGGGGGAGFVWREISAGATPLITEENFEVSYLFGSGLAQELYAAVKVPQSYSSGTQIFIYVSGYSPSSSNTILLQAQSTLIRSATDAFTPTTHQRTTTNAALTNTVANQLRQFTLDITSSTGEINSVAVRAGDVIKVRLYRGTDTDTADIRMIPNATDVKFS